jgi:hypothetical protein
MTPNEFIEWLGEYIDSPNLEDYDYTLWLLRKKLDSIETQKGYPFCGGKWDSLKFDYYWTPGHAPDE